MSHVVPSPSRIVVIVLALLVILASPLTGQPRALSAGSAGTGSGQDPAPASCDPADGPPLGSRFSGIGFVYLGTGSFAIESVDIGVPGRMAETFTRAYDSIDFRTTLLGPGWTNNFQTRLRGDGSGDILFTQPNGSVERFKGGLDNDRSVGTSRGYRVLTKEASGGWVVTDQAATWTFDASGSLIKAEDGHGDWVEVRYEGGHVSGTIGPDGPGLLFGIGPGDRLADVTLAADPTQFVRFEYDDDGRLVQAASSSAAPRRFAYDRDSERVTTISDEGGAVLLSVEYDDKDRVTREQDAQGLLDGEAVSYVYEELPDGGMRTTVTYPLSIFEHDWHPVQIAIHDSDSRLRELQLQPTSTQTLIGRYDYDAENRRIVLQDPCRTGSSADPMDGIAGLIRRFFLTLLGIFAR